jgi:hypothetical protein
MGSLVKYGSFDLDTLEKQDAQVAATTTVGADFMKMQPGKNRVRFLPSATPGESPLLIVNEHFVDTPDGQRVRFACPRLMDKEPCPACQEADRLKRTGNPIERDKAWNFYPKLRVYANVIDRDNPGSPRILAFGKMIWDGLKRIRKDKDEGGDFTNPLGDGFDIVITREGTGKNDTKYSVSAARSDSALTNNPDEIDELIESQWDLSKYSRTPTLEEAMDMMQNGYDKKGAQAAPSRKQLVPPAPAKKKRSTARAAEQVYDVDSDEIPY